MVKLFKLKFRQDSKLEFGQYFVADVFLEVLMLNLGRDSEARFGQGKAVLYRVVFVTGPPFKMTKCQLHNKSHRKSSMC